MDKDEQYLLFALSAPMEVLYSGNEPSHSSPAMYTGIDHVDLSDSWGIEDREELIQTIYRMTDDGHAEGLAGLYSAWFHLTPREWRESMTKMGDRGHIYARFVAETAMCCGEAGIKAWDYVRMGFLCRMGVLNKWLTEEESLWLQSRIYARAGHFYNGWMQYFAAYSLGRLYWQSSDSESLRDTLVRYSYDRSGGRMFDELVSSGERFYITLPWRPLVTEPECPETLKGVSDL
ncbi:DUF1266 domain-containing protein [Citrobacter enshiensis]|uniref:DUF1266 domain-containing protein n=1 Tax=Citrobacter enshiensis TaxID=2971264 RepID=UPI0023E77BAC|nr:DUF1266 domain-containing protein [Citrobacter enshiensis]WET39521.1 DUF1266 domain-containing protein [Citrobacter enshiensis]